MISALKENEETHCAYGIVNVPSRDLMARQHEGINKD